MERVEVGRTLRTLIKVARTDVARLSQRAAALKHGNISEAWWRDIETGRTRVSTADTLARMCIVTGVTSDQLRAIGEDHVADVMESVLGILAARAAHVDMESHLMATPDLTDEQRVMLVTLAKALRNKT